MSVAGPIDQPSLESVQPRRLLNRRTVLGTAVAGGAAVAAVRLLGLDAAVEHAIARTGPSESGGTTDWISPLASDKGRVNHLLRRTTFGATQAELEQALSDGYTRTVDRLLETMPEQPPSFGLTNGAGLNIGQLQLWWTDHIIKTSTPFAERMTLFWHDHFTSDYRKVGTQTPFIYWQNLTWRNMALSDLRSMLLHVTADPGMLRYLDLATSTGVNPNENYSRELMELFALGVGHYAEDDVRAAAKGLAGWTEPKPAGFQNVTVDAKNVVTRRLAMYGEQAPGVFDARRAYRGGQVRFLGKTQAWDTEKVIDQILAQPNTAPFIATKAAAHFLSGKPHDALIKRLGDRFRASKYDVKTLLRDLFTSPEFVADGAYRALVKSPTEFMVHALKALGAPQLSRLVVASGHDQGQVLFDPPDVGGWPNNEAWISSNTVVARVNFASGVLSKLPALPPVGQALGQIDSVVSPATASLLNQAADDHARWFLTLASPEFQLK
jgi:uncharacterized protein (DUF1800 family)